VFNIRCSIFIILFGAVFSCTNKADLIANPQPGDIYILEDQGFYYPMKIDSVAKDEIYMVNSKYIFTDVIPKSTDLPDHEFDHTVHLIYKKDEFRLQFEKGSVVEVYRE
jgi:hypothetical protein